MKTIKVLECPCGEEVYENDYGDDPNDGLVWCINCGRHFSTEQLEEVSVDEVRHV